MYKRPIMHKISRIIIGTLLALLLLGGPAFIGIGLYMHGQLADISNGCRNRSNSPASFSDHSGHFDPEKPDLTIYYMEEFETVTFESRESGINLSAWYIPAGEGAPAVISVHGLGSCKYSVVNLMQAGMLHNAGYAVLVMDVRDSGDSDYEDGLSAIGNEEYLDVLGGFDWLQANKGHSAEQIGILGNSLGAATALIAFAQEPDLAAAFVDSPFDNLPQIIQEELAREGFPQFLYAAGLIAAQIRGDDIAFNNPHDAIDRADGRPIFITHGTADGRIGVHHAEQLRQRAEEQNADVTVWILDGYDHVKAVGQHTDAYEKELVSFFDGALK